MASDDAVFRPLVANDLPALLDLWVASWQAAYPEIDFAARRGWAENHFVELARDGATILVLETDRRLAGAVTIASADGYIDQIVVAHDLQRRGFASRLVDAARMVSPTILELHVNQDNAAAVAFYKREGFAVSDHGTNARSGAPTFRMTWRAMTIRNAVADDANRACEVLRRSITELCTADHHNDPDILGAWLANKTPETVKSWIARPDNSLLLAVDRDDVLAAGSVTDAGEIQLNYVSPDARFRGVSKSMLAALEARAVECGNAECHLVSTQTARRFYLSAGYSQNGAPEIRFGTLSSYPMIRNLAADAP